MNIGNVVSVLEGKARARNRREWEYALDRIWPDVVRELKATHGCQEAHAMWCDDDSGRVMVTALWNTMEDRLGYEAGAADQVRPLFNSIFLEVVGRFRFQVNRSTNLRPVCAADSSTYKEKP